MSTLRSEEGTTLIEAVVAIGILAGAVVALAGLSSVATRNSAAARERSMATTLAYQKMEVLCRDVSAAAASPANAWAVDTPGYVEHLDRHGNLAGGRSSAAYVRRWSITPLPSDGSLLAIQVGVAPCRTVTGSAGRSDVLSHVRLASIRSRAAR